MPIKMAGDSPLVNIRERVEMQRHIKLVEDQSPVDREKANKVLQEKMMGMANHLTEHNKIPKVTKLELDPAYSIRFSSGNSASGLYTAEWIKETGELTRSELFVGGRRPYLTFAHEMLHKFVATNTDDSILKNEAFYILAHNAKKHGWKDSLGRTFEDGANTEEIIAETFGTYMVGTPDVTLTPQVIEIFDQIGDVQYDKDGRVIPLHDRLFSENPRKPAPPVKKSFFEKLFELK